MVGVFLDNDTYKKAQADLWEQDARQRVADAWEQNVRNNLPDLMGWAHQQIQNTVTGGGAVPSPSPAPAPQTGTVAPPVASPPSTSSPVSGYPVAQTSAGGGDYQSFARQAAQNAGINPDTFVRQIQQESGFNPQAKSPAGATGIAQFMPDTAKGLGIDPNDPYASLTGAANYMAQLVKNNGGDLGKALAAYNAGQGNVDKYGGVPPFEETQRYVSNILSGSPTAASTQGSTASSQAGGVSQFELGLDPQSAYAFCGPAAAIAFANSHGRYPTAQEAKALAEKYGWTPEAGMAGIQSEQKLLTEGLGIPTHVEQQVDWSHVATDAQNGNPVIVSTPGHYFEVSADPNTGRAVNDQGQYYVGKSGTALKGGSEWMSPDEIQSRMGQVQGAIYADNPQSPIDSIAKKAGEFLGGVAEGLESNKQAAMANPLEQFGKGFQGAVQNIASGNVGQGILQAGEAGVGLAGSMIPGRGADVSVPIATGLERAGVPSPYREIIGQGANLLLPASDEGLVAGLVGRTASKAAGRAAEALPKAAGEFLANESGQVQAPQRTASAFEQALNVPANQATANMLGQKPPGQTPDSIYNKLVRAWTNPNVSADQFQEQALRGAGISIQNPPENLDLSARLRQLATDGSVKVAEDTVLRPAVLSLGTDPAARQVLSSYLVHMNNNDIATATGNTYRRFPGGGSLIQSNTALSQMQQQLGPQEWRRVQDAANQVYGLIGQLRQRMLSSGLIDQHEYNMWQGQMPHWVPTRILDFMDETGAHTPSTGSKITLSDNGVRHYTFEGTDRFREDPLGSILGLVGQVESKARKNEAVGALLGLDRLNGTPLLQATDAAPTAGQSIVQYINNGTVERYLAPPQLAAVINGHDSTLAPGFVRAWTGFIRAVTTTLSPVFALARNPTLDVPEYLQRSLSRAGGDVRAMPMILAELGRGYADAFQGLLQGEFRGPNTQRYLAGGGSGSGMVNTFEKRQNITESLSRVSPFQIRGPADIARITTDVLQLKPIAAIAERAEKGPRVAAMRLAERRGMTQLRSFGEGRSVTIDFNEAGTLARTLNSFIPFFNAGVQGSAQVVRAARENPTGFATSTMMLVGLPAVMAELWNNSDPQRAQDYADVPQYLKDQGIVVMNPLGDAVDKDGNRKPGILWYNVRGYAPFAIAAREATSRVLQAMGNGSVRPEDALGALGSLTWSSMPIRASSVSDVPGSLLPQFVPGATTGLQVALNKDFFRNSDIVTNRKDENAPQLAKDIAAGATAIARLQNPAAEIHPAQIDFIIKDMLGGVGQAAEGAYQMKPGTPAPQDNSLQNQPVVGGLTKAVGLRNDTGQLLQNARSEGLTPGAQRLLNDLNLQQPSPVGSEFSVGSGPYAAQVPLLQREQATYQQAFDRNASQLLLRYGDALRRQRDPAQLQKDYQTILDAARQKARAEVTQGMNVADVKKRIAANQAKLHGAAP